MASANYKIQKFLFAVFEAWFKYIFIVYTITENDTGICEVIELV